MQFWKYQGLGNDFVLLDRRDDVEASADLARSLCDRRLGIGADGLLSVCTPNAGADARMAYRNADGSRAETCGNGLRCLVRHLHDEAPRKREWTVETDAGTRRCVVHVDAASGDLESVEVDMGPAELLGGVDEALDVDGRRVRLTRLSLGNSHAVTFDDFGPRLRETLGPVIERHAIFPNGTNVAFAAVDPDEADRLTVTVFERGVGFTRACGSGACATAAAACLTGRASFETPLSVVLPGGTLAVSVARDLSALRMRGPAVRVFTGSVAGRVA